ncbi:MAG: hypothetical protein Q6373_001435 [Candidatus Sigynarchaeota archaeon]
MRKANSRDRFEDLVGQYLIDGEFIAGGAYFVKRAGIDAFKDRLAKEMHDIASELKSIDPGTKETREIHIKEIVGNKLNDFH